MERVNTWFCRTVSLFVVSVSFQNGDDLLICGCCDTESVIFGLGQLLFNNLSYSLFVYGVTIHSAFARKLIFVKQRFVICGGRI